MLFTQKMPFLWHDWRHQGESQYPGLSECNLAFPVRLIVNPGSDGNVAALGSHSLGPAHALCPVFLFLQNEQLMDYFSIQTKHCTVCPQCCLYNPELSFLPL